MNAQATEPCHVLIVDDEPINIQLLGSVLSDCGYEVQFATSGEEALDWVNSESFDLVLLDLMMPVMDGYEVCRRIKQNPATQTIPIMFLSASVSVEKITMGYEAGAVDFVSKPFNRIELITKVGTHLELKRRREEVMGLQRELDEVREEIERLKG